MIFGGGEARDPWRCGASAKKRNDATVKKDPGRLLAALHSPK
jgi:hypothetical protein